MASQNSFFFRFYINFWYRAMLTNPWYKVHGYAQRIQIMKTFQQKQRQTKRSKLYPKLSEF